MRQSVHRKVSADWGGGEGGLPKSPTLLFFFTFFQTFFFSNFFYHAFIVFRYKKLRAALAIERTKPIIKKQNTKETIFPSSLQICKKLGLQPLANALIRERFLKGNS